LWTQAEPPEVLADFIGLAERLAREETSHGHA
jgi:hypothetical protein